MERQPLSRQPHGRKHSSTRNAFSSSLSPSFSVKEPYDDVSFSRGENSKFGIHEYAEIFSGSPSSIPVLDLSSLDERVRSAEFRSSRLDYSNIFGEVRNDEVAVPYEELVSGAAKKTKMQIPVDVQPPCPESSSQHSSEKPQKSSSEATDQSSIDSMKQQLNISFNKTNQRNNNEPNGKTHITQLHAVPGFTHFVDGAGASPLHKKEGDSPLSSLKREVSRTWSFNVGVNNGLTVETSHVPVKPDDLNKINPKLHSLEVPSPSSHPCNPFAESDPRRSKFPSFDSKDVSKKTDGECSLPIFDEELDENSAAALSAAALKKAVEQAQESIRIARMIMERQKENLQGGPKPRSWGCLKVKDDNGTRIGNEADGSVENNAWDTYEGLDAFPIFTGINGKFAPTLRNTEKFLNTRKAEEVERIGVKVEAAKENGNASSSEVGKRFAAPWNQKVETPEACQEAMNFKGLGTNKECRTEALELGEVDNHGHLTCSIEKLQSHLGEIETLTGTLEQLTNNKSKGDEANAELAEGAPSTSNNMQEVGKRVDDALVQIDASVCIRKGADDIAESSERVLPSSKSMQQQGMIVHETDENLSIMQEEEVMEQRDDVAGITLKHEKKFVDTEEMVLGEYLTVRKSELNNLLRGFHCLVDEDILRLEGMGNGDHGQRNDQEESRVRYEDGHLCFGNEWQLKDPLEGEISEGEPEIFPVVGEDRKNVNVVHEQEMDGRKQKYETLDRAPSEFDAGKTTQMEAKHYADVHKGEVSCGAVEIKDTHRDAGRSEENNDNFDFQDAASVNSVGETVGTHINDTGNVSSEIQEPCNADLNDKVEEYEAAVEGCKDNGSSTRIADAFISAVDNEAGKLFNQEVNEMPGTDSLRRCASEENFIGSKLIGAFEGFSSDSSTDIAGFVDVDHEEKLPRPVDFFKVASKINDVAEEEAAKLDIRSELEETLESIRCSVSSSHESQERAENAGDDTSNKEEVKCDLDMTIDVNEYIEEQRERLSLESEEVEEGKNIEKNMENLSGLSTMKQKDGRGKWQKVESRDRQQRIEAIKKGREREKDRKVVERAIREARERAFAEAREKAERAAVKKAAAEARQRVTTEALEKFEKASMDSKQSADKLSTEAKIRAERAAVERATAEARERALEKAMSQRTYVEAKTQVERYSTERLSTTSRDKGLKHSFSSSDLEKFDETTSESAQRRKARLERHQRIMERAAKALAEKNKRDLLAQKEQAEKNRLADTLNAEIKRWAAGKEGNLRALLSTLQYILGPDSGWQQNSLTEIITTAAVKKAYRKATLCVHPDKLQQRGATIQQKYICEKVFDLLKAAWNRFNSEEN